MAHLWRSRVSPRHKHKFHGGAIFKGRKHGIPLLSAGTQRFLAANLNIPTPRVELYINKTKPEAFRRRRRISYPYPTPIVVCAGLLLCCRGNRRKRKWVGPTPSLPIIRSVIYSAVRSLGSSCLIYLFVFPSFP